MSETLHNKFEQSFSEQTCPVELRNRLDIMKQEIHEDCMKAYLNYEEKLINLINQDDNLKFYPHYKDVVNNETDKLKNKLAHNGGEDSLVQLAGLKASNDDNYNGYEGYDLGKETA